MAVIVLLVLVASAAFASVISPHPPTEIGTGTPLGAPSSEHLFGTDQLGRDLFSRTMHGGRLALRIMAIATLVALVVGTAWGAVAAFLGGWADDVLMRVVDATLAIPFLLMALVLVAGFGATPSSLALILGLVHAPMTARVARAGVLSELHREYVLAAKAFGTGTVRLLWSEVLPNVLPTLLVQATVVAASVLLSEAALSFVGLGIQPPDASWGSLILEGYNNINSTSTAIIFPGAMMFIALWALSVLGDHIQAVLDPGSASTMRATP